MYRISDECVSCETCLEICPEGAIKPGEPFFITKSCNDCGKCLEICPVEAIFPGPKQEK